MLTVLSATDVRSGLILARRDRVNREALGRDAGQGLTALHILS